VKTLQPAESPSRGAQIQSDEAAPTLERYAHDIAARRLADRVRLHASAQSLAEANEEGAKPAPSLRVINDAAARELAGRQDLKRLKLSLPCATDSQLLQLAPLIARLERCELTLDCTVLTVPGVNRFARELKGTKARLTVCLENPQALPDETVKKLADTLGLVFSRQGDKAWLHQLGD